MLGRCTLGGPPTPPNLDVQNGAIRPISMRGGVGSDMLGGGGGRGLVEGRLRVSWTKDGQ